MDEKDFTKCLATFLVSFNELQKSVEKVLNNKSEEDTIVVISDFIVETIAFFDVNKKYIDFIRDIKNKNESKKTNDSSSA